MPGAGNVLLGIRGDNLALADSWGLAQANARGAIRLHTNERTGDHLTALAAHLADIDAATAHLIEERIHRFRSGLGFWNGFGKGLLDRLDHRRRERVWVNRSNGFGSGSIRINRGSRLDGSIRRFDVLRVYR